MSLLFWRAFCDFGISCRFLLTPAFDLQMCGNTYCDVTSVFAAAQQAYCAVPSAMFEFFEIASEGFFFCVAIDLYITATDPFSAVGNRMRYYHVFVWTVALCFMLPTLTNTNVFGYWTITSSGGTNVENSAFCWIQIGALSRGMDLKAIPWAMFYTPLIITYGVSVYVVITAYNRLKSGISKTFQHRVRVLLTNSINIGVCLLYWLFLIVFYVSTFLLVSGGTNNFTHARITLMILQYMIPAKGVSTIIVWILVTNLNLSEAQSKSSEQLEGAAAADDGGDTAALDLNSALRQEVLFYATAGIRSCTKSSIKLKEDPHKIVVRLNHGIEQSKSTPFTPLFFMRLVMGMPEQVNELSIFVNDSDKRLSMALQDKSRNIRNTMIEIDDRNSIGNGGARKSNNSFFPSNATPRFPSSSLGPNVAMGHGKMDAISEGRSTSVDSRDTASISQTEEVCWYFFCFFIYFCHY